MRKHAFLYILYSLEATTISPGLNTWFSASKLSYAGGGSLIFNPTSRVANPASYFSERCFSTSFILLSIEITSNVFPSFSKTFRKLS